MHKMSFVKTRQKFSSGGNRINVFQGKILQFFIAVLFLISFAGISDALAIVGPSLSIQDQIPATAGSTVSVPVSFAANGNSVAALAFSIDFDQTLLTFDPTDADEDGIPDSIVINAPASFGLKSVSYDATDTDGELDFIISDIAPPLSALTDRVIVTITFTTLIPAGTSEAAVNFSSNPSASFGTTAGGSVPGTTDNGSVLIQFASYYCDKDFDTYYNSSADGSCSGALCPPPGCSLTQGTDCNDGNFAIKPGATELCDGVDNDCDGQTDEGVKNTYYRDFDGDTYGDAGNTTQACTQPAGYVTNSLDCNDSNAAIKPGATEVCDGVDNDCDGSIDEGVKNTYYRDFDGDTYGDAGNTTQACTQPAGYVSNNTDCNDNNANIKPGATEVCDGVDNDCDGSIDEGVKNTYYRDLDGDTYGNPGSTTQACTQPAGYVSNNTDCNDNNAAIKPGATEVCDGVDNDCDGSIDEGVKNTYYRDFDGDTYGDPGNTTQACTQPAGYVSNNTDCDDNDNKEHPNQTWYKDSDGDGYSDGTTNTASCTRPAGYKVASELTATSGDCNDSNAAIKPGATEVCDGVDNDCDGSIDEGVKNTYYRDFDGDTYGDPGNTTQACTQPAGYVSNNTDCDDNDNKEHPNQTWYKDSDGDGYSNGTTNTASCTRPAGYKVASELTATSGDCNDSNAAIKPGATEVCDGVDNDCDGSIDEGVKNTYYRDFDGDTYGDPGNTTQACTQPAGYVSNNTDCDDNDNKEHPNQTWYKDSDGDGYSNGTTNTASCTRPAGYKVASELTATSGDCNDNNIAVNPGTDEICDGIDNNCNGQVDEGVKITYYRDLDGDTYGNPGNTTQACSQPAGYVTNHDDCNDNNAAIRPWALEVQDGVDNNCNGQTDENVNNVTIPTATGLGDFNLTTNSPGCSFYDVRAITEAQASDDPGFNYPCGLVEFKLNCTVADVTITCTGITELESYTYRKYGPTTPGDVATTDWYTFNNITVAGNSVTLHLQDGQLGDDTGVDGIIFDQGGPGDPDASIPTMNEWGMIIFTIMAGLMSLYYIRRHRRTEK